MTLRDLRGKTAVVGVGQAGLGQARGYTEQEVLAQAAMAAISDAGLSLKDIDGITTCSSLSPMWAMSVVRAMQCGPGLLRQHPAHRQVQPRRSDSRAEIPRPSALRNAL
jgi:acetyl-CoA acetyltransferase